MKITRIDAASFDLVASSECRRWHPRSLKVARALLVDWLPLSVVAADADMSSQQANIIRNRFFEKVKHARLRQFMANTSPEAVAQAASLETYRSEIETLRDRGYTDDQIAAYLAEISVKTTAAEIREFLRKHRA
jgi:hypothetical protein